MAQKSILTCSTCLVDLVFFVQNNLHHQNVLVQRGQKRWCSTKNHTKVLAFELQLQVLFLKFWFLPPKCPVKRRGPFSKGKGLNLNKKTITMISGINALLNFAGWGGVKGNTPKTSDSCGPRPLLRQGGRRLGHWCLPYLPAPCGQMPRCLHRRSRNHFFGEEREPVTSWPWLFVVCTCI